MTPENFCYWLQGFFEIENPKKITEQQLQEIKNHLQLVFNKVTPKHTTEFSNLLDARLCKSTLIKHDTPNRNCDIFPSDEIQFEPEGSC